MDPELYELTTAKLDASAPSSRVADAFARLMSTMDKTSTATRSEVTVQHISKQNNRLHCQLLSPILGAASFKVRVLRLMKGPS